VEVVVSCVESVVSAALSDDSRSGAVESAAAVGSDAVVASPPASPPVLPSPASSPAGSVVSLQLETPTASQAERTRSRMRSYWPGVAGIAQWRANRSETSA